MTLRIGCLLAGLSQAARNSFFISVKIACSFTAATRPPDDPFGLRAGNAVLSCKVDDLIGTSHAHAEPPPCVRSVSRYGRPIGLRHIRARLPMLSALYALSRLQRWRSTEVAARVHGRERCCARGAPAHGDGIGFAAS